MGVINSGLTTPILKTNFNSNRIAGQMSAASCEKPQKPPSMMKEFCLLFFQKVRIKEMNVELF
jgi:hypothetical protein